jgi:hypothetical protein
VGGAGAGSEGGSGAGTPHDIVIYGCTSAGLMAAVQAKSMQKSVILVCPETFLGGLTTQGLGWTDSGDKSVIRRDRARGGDSRRRRQPTAGSRRLRAVQRAGRLRLYD